MLRRKPLKWKHERKESHDPGKARPRKTQKEEKNEKYP
jgi:hypothetical protein